MVDNLMPLRVHLDEVLADRDMTLTALADQVGITIANLSILKTGKARAVRFSTLAAICDALDCQPGDLISYAPPTKERLREAGADASGTGRSSDSARQLSHARASSKRSQRRAG